jgi:uncharacterized protein YbjQ (UPF0145 family)
VIISTMNELPGHEIEEVFGEAFGLTVRSRNLGSAIGAVLKSLVGGELKGMTKMLAAGRRDATSRLVEEAEAKGANAIIAFRFDTSELARCGPRSALPEQRCACARPDSSPLSRVTRLCAGDLSQLRECRSGVH